MKLLSEDLNSKVELLTENTKNGKEFFIEGVFAQADTINGNGRIYPGAIMFPEVENYINDYVNRNRALGEIEHPERPNVDLNEASHMITELRIEGSNVIGKAKLLKTRKGRLASELLESGVQLGVSTRALGSVFTRDDGIDEVQDDFKLFAVDIVHTPSAPDAFVNGLMESVDWKIDKSSGRIYKIDRTKLDRIILEAKIEKLKKFLKA